MEKKIASRRQFQSVTFEFQLLLANLSASILSFLDGVGPVERNFGHRWITLGNDFTVIIDRPAHQQS